MSFYHLELFFALSWHYELNGGDLRLVGRLEALSGITQRPGRFEVLEKGRKEVAGRGVPDWRQTEIEVPTEAVARLVERIRAVWSDDRAPRPLFGCTANTAWHSLILTITLNESSWYLPINPIENLAGADLAPLRAFFRELSNIAGLAGTQRDFPSELVAE